MVVVHLSYFNVQILNFNDEASSIFAVEDTHYFNGKCLHNYGQLSFHTEKLTISHWKNSLFHWAMFNSKLLVLTRLRIFEESDSHEFGLLQVWLVVTNGT